MIIFNKGKQDYHRARIHTAPPSTRKIHHGKRAMAQGHNQARKQFIRKLRSEVQITTVKCHVIIKWSGVLNPIYKHVTIFFISYTTSSKVPNVLELQFQNLSPKCQILIDTTCEKFSWFNYVEKQGILLGWPKSSFGFFHTTVHKKLNELFGQTNIIFQHIDESEMPYIKKYIKTLFIPVFSPQYFWNTMTEQSSSRK